MNVCIFIPGLGEAFAGTTSRNYAKHMAYEMDINNEAKLKYRIKEEKLDFTDQGTTHCISIFSENEGLETLAYRFYDFSYRDILTKEFNQKNVFMKCILLLMTVIKKLPVILKRLFVPTENGYQSQRLRLTALYTFVIFLVISLCGISLIPGALTLILEVIKDNKELGAIFADHGKFTAFLSGVQKSLLSVISVILIIFSLFPSSKEILTGLAVEFTCIHYYLEYGERNQVILGRLNSLVQFIAEREMAEMDQSDMLHIDFHAYSFGSIVSLDFLFPINRSPAKHTVDYARSLVSIGCPYEFVSSYYPKYFEKRSKVMAEHLKWYNVVSQVDALASNFRNDGSLEPSTFSIAQGMPLPLNLHYDIATADPAELSNFLTLYALRAHQFYWGKTELGDSCVGNIYQQLKSDSLIV